METKFTPGPWRSDIDELGSLVDGPPDSNGEEMICACRGPDREANIKLIAAAPEMYRSLAIMTALCRLKYGNIDADVYAEIEKAEAVLAKAVQP